jgi:hypothetical protein
MKRVREIFLAVATLVAFAAGADAALRVLKTQADEQSCIQLGGKVVVQSDGKTKVCVMPPPPPDTAAPH